jgi:hypothetical protein
MKIPLLRSVVLLCCISGYHKCLAALSFTSGRQETLTCEDEAKIEGYFLVDVVVEPGMVSASEIKLLEESFQDTFDNAASNFETSVALRACSWVRLNGTYVFCSCAAHKAWLGAFRFLLIVPAMH